MSAQYTEADLERARRCKLSFSRTGLAQLIADVRAEERERCAKICDDLAKMHEREAQYERQEGASYCAECIRSGES